MKAIKNGEDPNATNPVPEEEEQESIASQDVRTFDGSVAEQPSPSRQPPIEEIPEESGHLKARELTQQLSLDESLHTSRVSSLQWPPATSNYDILSVLGDIPGSPARTKDISNPQLGDLELSSFPGTIGYSSSVPNLPGIPGASTLSGADALRTLHPFPPPAISSSVAVPAQLPSMSYRALALIFRILQLCRPVHLQFYVHLWLMCALDHQVNHHSRSTNSLSLWQRNMLTERSLC
jgi:vacuolar protein sorting-associated protein VTA1